MTMTSNSNSRLLAVRKDVSQDIIAKEGSEVLV